MMDGWWMNGWSRSKREYDSFIWSQWSPWKHFQKMHIHPFHASSIPRRLLLTICVRLSSGNHSPDGLTINLSKQASEIRRKSQQMGGKRQKQSMPSRLPFSVRRPRWRRWCPRKTGRKRRCSPPMMTSISCWPGCSWLPAEGEVTPTITVSPHTYEMPCAHNVFTLLTVLYPNQKQRKTCSYTNNLKDLKEY